MFPRRLRELLLLVLLATAAATTTAAAVESEQQQKQDHRHVNAIDENNEGKAGFQGPENTDKPPSNTNPYGYLEPVTCSASTLQYETFLIAHWKELDLSNTRQQALSSITQTLQNQLQDSYNHLQKLHCDRPYHREMTSVQLLTSSSATGSGSFEDQYLVFKANIATHESLPSREIALDAATNRRMLLLKEKDENEASTSSSGSIFSTPQESSSSSSTLPPPLLLRRQRQLQSNECTCPLELAAVMFGGSPSEKELQQEFNRRLVAETTNGNTGAPGADPVVLQFFSPNNNNGGDAIDEILQLSPVAGEQGGQCGGGTTGASGSFVTVLILHVDLRQGWQYSINSQDDQDELVNLQLRLLQDSYNDQAFRNCDQTFRRIQGTSPILLGSDADDANANRRQRKRRKLQRTLKRAKVGVSTRMTNRTMSNSNNNDHGRQLLQTLATNNNKAFIAVYATMECLHGNCPTEPGTKKALSDSFLQTRRRRRRRTESTTTITHDETKSSNSVPREKNGEEPSRQIVPIQSYPNNGTDSSAADHRYRHLMLSDAMNGCFCPSHLPGTKDAPTSQELEDTMNHNMERLSSSSNNAGSLNPLNIAETSTLIDQVANIDEVEVYDCSDPPTTFTTFISSIMMGQKNLVTDNELSVLGDAFESTYNTVMFQTCDPYHRTIDAVEVFIPPQADSRRRRRLNGKDNNSTSSYVKGQRSLQPPSSSFVTGYLTTGTCIGLCPAEDTLFTGDFGTRRERERQRRAAAAAAGSTQTANDRELRSWFESPLGTSHRDLQQGLPEGQCICAAGLDESFLGPNLDTVNTAYTMQVEELKASGEVTNVDSVEMVDETLLCMCEVKYAETPEVEEGIRLLHYHSYPCNLGCDEFEERFGSTEQQRRRRRLRKSKSSSEDEICDRGIFACPVDDEEWFDE